MAGKKTVKTVIGYCRVSTMIQDNERQKNDILGYAQKKGLLITEMKSEIISSRKKDREIYLVMDALNKDDVLIITELSRLGRSTIEINDIVGKALNKGIVIMVINNDVVIDNSIGSKAIVFALGISAEMERDLISERTKSALKVLKDKGVKLGRPKGSSILQEKKTEIEDLLKLGMNVSMIARYLKVSRITVTKFIQVNGLKEVKGD